MEKPVVSILCLTYNQEKYVEQVIKGFLSQKIDFPVEIIIHDDASTDKTKKIIENYAKKHPKNFKPIYEKQNQYSKGLLSVFLEKMYKTARGKYIVWCEGDDYWTDPQKLQIQIDFMEKNPDHAICFHPVNVTFENSKEHKIYPIPGKNQVFNVQELLKNNFIQTSSVMYRKQKYKAIPRGIMPTDWYMHLYHAQFGKIGFIDRVMSTYRKHPGGEWWESTHNQDKLWEKHGTAHLQFFVEVLKLYGGSQQNRSIIEKTIGRSIDNSISTKPESKNILLEKVIKEFPQFIKPTILYQHEKITEQKTAIAHKQAAIDRRDEELKKIKAKQHKSVFGKVKNRLPL